MLVHRAYGEEVHFVDKQMSRVVNFVPVPKYINIATYEAAFLIVSEGVFDALLRSGMDDSERLHQHERTGRPLGNMIFIEEPERVLDRVLKLQTPGQKRNIYSHCPQIIRLSCSYLESTEFLTT